MQKTAGFCRAPASLSEGPVKMHPQAVRGAKNTPAAAPAGDSAGRKTTDKN
ncbi:hypothetical protein LHL23_21395 [Leisingera sp. McT4-56]|nr:hypothetical protein [Leisingera sp. McT4-56]